MSFICQNYIAITTHGVYLNYASANGQWVNEKVTSQYVPLRFYNPVTFNELVLKPRLKEST